MKDEELQRLVETISNEYFLRPFVHKATFNSRLRTTGGRYFTSSHNLEFNPKSLQRYGEDELIGIIKHELCHYHLHLQGKGYLHKDNEFKECLKSIGGSRFNKSLQKKKVNPYRYQLICKQCQQIYLRKRRVDLTKYRCGRCGGELNINSLK